jgi:hypothetical protein
MTFPVSQIDTGDLGVSALRLSVAVAIEQLRTAQRRSLVGRKPLFELVLDLARAGGGRGHLTLWHRRDLCQPSPGNLP